MEITVRTYDEVSNERVRIEVAPGQRAEIQIVDDRVSTYANQAAEVLAENYARAQARIRELEAELVKRPTERLYTAEEVGDLQAREAELVAAPLRRQVQELTVKLAQATKGHVCTESCKPNAHVAFTGRKRLQEAEAQVREYDRDRKTELDRADQNKAWAERAEQRLADQAEENRQSIAARDGLLATATKKINYARELLSAGEVDQARRMDLTRTGTVMAGAIGAALRVLDQA